MSGHTSRHPQTVYHLRIGVALAMPSGVEERGRNYGGEGGDLYTNPLSPSHISHVITLLDMLRGIPCLVTHKMWLAQAHPYNVLQYWY